MGEYRIELYEDKAGEYRWRMVSENGRIVATGAEGYTRLFDCNRAVDQIKAKMPGAHVTVDYTEPVKIPVEMDPNKARWGVGDGKVSMDLRSVVDDTDPPE